MIRYSISLLFLLFALPALSGVMPDKSRVIYRENSAAETVMLVNTNNYPVMIQLWTDDGDTNKTPEQANAPFVATPVMSKLNAQQLNPIKVIFSGNKKQLPQDKESLFWLNILEVPPKPKETPGVEKIALSMLTQMKIIYRPKAINAKSEQVIEKLSQLAFRLNKESDRSFSLTVNNPSPFVASFSAIQLLGKEGGKTVTLNADTEIDLLVLPKSSQTFRFSVESGQKISKIDSVNYALVNDEGKYITLNRKL